MKTVAIIEGWAGGPRLSKFFREELNSSGLMTTRDTRNADVIIAHSAGCSFVPKKNQASLFMLIDPPYWPGESIIARWMKMNKNEAKFLRKKIGTKNYLKNKLWEAYYVFAKPAYTWSVLKNQSSLEFLNDISESQVIVVRNTFDEFCSPEIKHATKGLRNVKYSQVPGYHGDFYINPRPYVDLILKEL